ncbi:MAG: VOC family protein [Bacteroidota bacterium]
MKYVHTNIITSNWKRLAQFYIDVFECQVVPPQRKQVGEWLERGTAVLNAALEGVHLRLPGYQENGPTLEIYQYHEIIPQSKAVANREGFGHLAFEVEDVQAILDKMIQHGGSAHGEVSEAYVEGKGKITFTYAKDPDGNLIELQSWE